MTPQIMTADEAFNVSMNQYPSLYTSINLELSRFKYFDHVFNTIGNGYRTLEEFIEGHSITLKNHALTFGFPEKYIGEHALYSVSTKTIDYGSYSMPDHHSELDGLYTEDEIKSMPEEFYILQINKHYDFSEIPQDIHVPYPGFNKEYAMIWKMDMMQLDISWTLEAINFYEKCYEFFNSENAHLFHGAVSEDPQKVKRAIEDYEQFFKDYKKEGMTEQDYFDAISKAYELEYTGDTLDFMNRRWELRKSEIMEFISDSLNHLHEIKNKKNPKMKM